MPEKPIEQVQREHTPVWLGMAGVAGTALGLDRDGRACIKIYVVRRTPELLAQLPSSVDGYPVVVQEAGPFRTL